MIFRCHHRRYTWPQRRWLAVAGEPVSINYVCCLDCGAELEYDWGAMRLGDQVNWQHGLLQTLPRAARQPGLQLRAVPEGDRRTAETAEALPLLYDVSPGPD